MGLGPPSSLPSLLREDYISLSPVCLPFLCSLLLVVFTCKGQKEEEEENKFMFLGNNDWFMSWDQSMRMIERYKPQKHFMFNLMRKKIRH